MAVVGKLEDLIRRGRLNDRLLAGLHYLAELRTGFLDKKDIGYRHQIELVEGELSAIHQVYETRPVGQVRLEAHRRFVDIQFIHDGEEIIRLAPLAGARITIQYDESNDVAFFEADASAELLMRPGMAVVFYPDDLHAPGLHLAGRSLVRKTVVKAAV